MHLGIWEHERDHIPDGVHHVIFQRSICKGIVVLLNGLEVVLVTSWEEHRFHTTLRCATYFSVQTTNIPGDGHRVVHRESKQIRDDAHCNRSTRTRPNTPHHQVRIKWVEQPHIHICNSATSHRRPSDRIELKPTHNGSSFHSYNTLQTGNNI